ncbi:helix-turn-helix domain-containing protein [Vibrio scophthalmi]|uniref:Repressor protein C n=1 Tax=Vibrio scophthalmi TaxID=45658 RepID=A0A1E3WKR5_9VIBR|nr:helix-turn-helix transcriptional regulator [Vibrio scophthalmi]ODS10363.1 Repressor protein C [Vibrio scophthalmi]
MSFRKRLKAIIKEERRSQREFAEIVGIPLSTIEGYLNGKSQPTTGALEKIIQCEEYKKYTYWLMTGETLPESGQVCPSFSILEKCGLVDESSEQKRA